MEELAQTIARTVATWVELGASLLIAIGAIQALCTALPAAFLPGWVAGARRHAWKGLGRWLVLALEFELAADIIRSAIAPTWTDIGQLAAIAVIRTFLNYFLERELSSDSGDSAPGTSRGT